MQQVIKHCDQDRGCILEGPIRSCKYQVWYAQTNTNVFHLLYQSGIPDCSHFTASLGQVRNLHPADHMWCLRWARLSLTIGAKQGCVAGEQCRRKR